MKHITLIVILSAILMLTASGCLSSGKTNSTWKTPAGAGAPSGGCPSCG